MMIRWRGNKTVYFMEKRRGHGRKQTDCPPEKDRKTQGRTA
jgi:hypothetical protein